MTGGGLIPVNENIPGNPAAQNLNLNFPPTSAIGGNGPLGQPPAAPVNSEANNLLPGNNVTTPAPSSGAGNGATGQGPNGGTLPLGHAAPWAADLQAMSADVQASVRALQPTGSIPGSDERHGNHLLTNDGQHDSCERWARHHGPGICSPG